MGIVFFCALFGLLLGGPFGLVAGAAIGFAASWLLGPGLGRGMGFGIAVQQAQERFLHATFAVMGALSKADGVVTRAEIQNAQRVFDMLRLTAEQREQAKAAFNLGKSPEFDLDAEVAGLRSVVGRGPFLRLFLQLQCMAVAADGHVHEAEHLMLVRIARRLGLTELDVAQLEALLRAAAAGPGAASVSPQTRLDDAYTALGLTARASDADVKRAYRRLMSENHPDKLASRGMPESMRQVAEERTREINVAYELIKESRGFK